MKNIFLYGILAIGGYYLYQQSQISGKRKWLSDLDANDAIWKDAVSRMTNDEVQKVYLFLTEYAPVTGDGPQKQMPAPLQLEIQAISNKYNIFT